MAPWCIYSSCIESVARCGSGRGVVGTMNAARSRPDWLATVQSGRKQVQSRVCTPGLTCHTLRLADVQGNRQAPHERIVSCSGTFSHIRLNITKEVQNDTYFCSNIFFKFRVLCVSCPISLTHMLKKGCISIVQA